MFFSCFLGGPLLHGEEETSQVAYKTFRIRKDNMFLLQKSCSFGIANYWRLVQSKNNELKAAFLPTLVVGRKVCGYCHQKTNHNSILILRYEAISRCEIHNSAQIVVQWKTWSLSLGGFNTLGQCWPAGSAQREYIIAGTTGDVNAALSYVWYCIAIESTTIWIKILPSWNSNS